MALKSEAEKARVVLLDPPSFTKPENVWDSPAFCFGETVIETQDSRQEYISKCRKKVVEASLRAALQCCAKDAYVLMWGNEEMIGAGKVTLF